MPILASNQGEGLLKMIKNLKYPLCFLLLGIIGALTFFFTQSSEAQEKKIAIAPNRKALVVGEVYGFSNPQQQDTDKEGGTPVYIAQNSKGQLYVAYSGQQEEIQVFDRQGKFLFKFGQRGEGASDFSSYICSLAVNSRDEVYICDVLKRQVLVFNAEGKFLFSFSSVQGLTSEDQKQNTSPSHLAIDSQNRVYISDTANGHVWVHDDRGKFLYCLGGPEQGRYPTAAHLRFDKQGRIYILEGLANRIQVCDAQGKPLFTIGQTGSRVGEFLRISGLAIDSKTRIYISDIILSVIQVFDAEGKFLGVIKYAAKGETEYEFKGLSNIFIGGDDHIYLTELPFHRVTIIKDPN